MRNDRELRGRLHVRMSEETCNQTLLCIKHIRNALELGSYLKPISIGIVNKGDLQCLVCFQSESLFICRQLICNCVRS